MNKNALLGEKGEAFVRYDLYKQGATNVMSSWNGCSYDLVFQYNKKFYKAQVKTTETILTKPDYRKQQNKTYTKKVYRWQTNKSISKAEVGSYEKDDTNLFALVCLDGSIEKIIYVPFTKRTDITKSVNKIKNVDTSETFKDTLKGIN
tara:strand:- start:1922 stop:2365 length:444 start_codon:yes stop_codon:yes gene_type:complete